MKHIHRNRFLLLLIFLLSTVALQAQSRLSYRFQAGLATSDGPLDLRPYGGRTGLAFQHHLNSHFDVSISAGYYMQNEILCDEFGTFNGNFGLVTVRDADRMHFIDLEAEVGFWIGNRVRISLGSYLAHLVHADRKRNVVESGPNHYVENNSRIEYTSNWDRLNIGIRPSVSVRLSQALDIRLTYSRPLEPLTYTSQFGETDYFPQVLMLGVDWHFWRWGE